MSEKKEKTIQNEILEALSHKNVRIWRNNVGVARYKSDVVRYGLVGSADLTGILPDGRRLEIEVKRPGEWQTEPQKRFEAMIKAFHGVYLLVHSVEELEEQLTRFL